MFRLEPARGYSVSTLPNGPPRHSGVVCHLLCRGDQREPIFQNDAAHELFLKTLAQACAKTDWQAEAYGPGWTTEALRPSGVRLRLVSVISSVKPQ